MNCPPSPDQPSRPRRRWLRRLLVVTAILAAVLGWFAYLIFRGNWELAAAIAEADRLDPGWRFVDMEAVRAAVPDEENSALLVLAARARMPQPWLPPPAEGTGPGLTERLAELSSAERPRQADVTELRTEMDRVAPAVDVARGLADRPHGRHVVSWSNDLVGTLMPHTQDVREVNRLLCLDALRRALDGDGSRALRSCRAAVNTGRSLGDEPTVVSQLVRVASTREAIRALERSLGQGRADPSSLEALQHLLAAEAEEPLQLIAARSERASYYEFLEVTRTGKLNRASYGLKTGALGTTGDDLIDRFRARACEAVYLRYFNEVVEVARLPAEAQQERLEALPEPREKLPPLLEGLTRGGNWPKLARAFHRQRAEARCAAVALAAERHRQAEGHWPEGVGALVPRYLAAAPVDPFDGKPLRLRRLADGLVVYSVGLDGQDDGGNVDRRQREAPGTDLGFRLWDVERRGTAPAEK